MIDIKETKPIVPIIFKYSSPARKDQLGLLRLLFIEFPNCDSTFHTCCLGM